LTIGGIEKMSKSKRNVVDPESIIESYGADTARWFMLSDSPPERDIEWTEAGAEGAWKFTQRLWRIVGDASSRSAGPLPGEFGPGALELRRIAHRTLAAVTDDLSSLRFNRAIARIYELSNALSTALAIANPPPDLAFAIHESADFLVLMFAPMMPHLAEECWALMGHQQPVVETPWPKPVSALIVDDDVTIAVQVNGKRRDEIRLQKGMAKDQVEAAVMKLEGVKRALGGKPVVKFIVVPDRIVNIVVSG
jgi:leucyl-tRNA synthetase